MTDAVKLWRYYLPRINNDGWAIAVLGSDGFFSAVSDYGNCGYFWPHHGKPDIRHYFLNAGLECDYFRRKLFPEETHDGEQTYDQIRRHILEHRHADGGHWSKERAREEWDLLHESGVRDGSITEFHNWYQHTSIDDASSFSRTKPSIHAVKFCQKTLPRLADVIRLELAAECAAAASPTKGAMT